MRSEEYVLEKIKGMDKVDRFGTKKEIKELPNILKDDEELIYITSGFNDGNTWLIACTDKRILFLDKGMIFGLKQKEIPLDKIHSIECTTGLMFAKIKIWSGATSTEVEQISKDSAKIAVDKINKYIDLNKKATIKSIASEEKQGDEDLISKLEKLATLKEKGVLSEEEFKQAKLKILSN